MKLLYTTFIIAAALLSVVQSSVEVEGEDRQLRTRNISRDVTGSVSDIRNGDRDINQISVGDAQESNQGDEPTDATEIFRFSGVADSDPGEITIVMNQETENGFTDTVFGTNLKYLGGDGEWAEETRALPSNACYQVLVIDAGGNGFCCNGSKAGYLKVEYSKETRVVNGLFQWTRSFTVGKCESTRSEQALCDPNN